MYRLIHKNYRSNSANIMKQKAADPDSQENIRAAAAHYQCAAATRGSSFVIKGLSNKPDRIIPIPGKTKTRRKLSHKRLECFIVLLLQEKG